MNKILALVLGLVFISVVSCKRNSLTSSPSSGDSTDVALSNFSVNEIDFTYFHFKSKVDYTDGTESQNFTINGRVKKDSIIWLSVTPGLGIEAMRCLILKDSIFILDRIHNKLSVFDFSYINKTFNTDLRFENIQSLFVGNLAFPMKPGDKFVKKEDLGFFLLRQLRNTLKVDSYVTANTLKIERLEIQNNADNSFMEVHYSNFAPLDTFLFANSIKTIIKFNDRTGKEKTTLININHTKAEIVAKPLNFPFNIPKRFEEK
jgi:hypothetical protein